jgi:hypothetical protein
MEDGQQGNRRPPHWSKIRDALVPAKLDDEPAKWEWLGELAIKTKASGQVYVWLFSTSESPGAFATGPNWPPPQAKPIRDAGRGFAEHGFLDAVGNTPPRNWRKNCQARKLRLETIPKMSTLSHAAFRAVDNNQLTAASRVLPRVPAHCLRRPNSPSPSALPGQRAGTEKEPEHDVDANMRLFSRVMRQRWKPGV